MTLAWSCIAFPEHGAHRQDGIAALQDAITDFRRGIGKAQRFACPICCSQNLPGWVRPATKDEVVRLITGDDPLVRDIINIFTPDAARNAADQGVS